VGAARNGLVPLSRGTGIAVFVRQAGAGRPLVLLHGLLVSGEMFDPLVGAWSARHRLIVPDLRGHGRSAHLPGPYTVGQQAADVADLLGRMNVPRADVLGYSQGGTVAQQFARDHPDRVGRLVLACTYSYNLLSRRERLEGLLSSWLLATLGPAAMTGLIARGVGGPALSATQTAALRRMLAANDRRRAVAAHRAMLAFDSRGWLTEITAPTLVICGSADRAVPGWHAEMLARGIPHAELRTIDGAGHLLAWTHTAQLVEIVETWLSGPPDRDHEREWAE
jgi:pimeloyl-ACP methyl ester carboxylesterase